MRFILRKRGQFGLLLPVCDDHSARDRAVASLAYRKRHLIVRLKDGCTDPLRDVRAMMAVKTWKPTAIHIIGLSEAVPSDGSRLGALEALNLRRGQWEGLGCPVLIWVPQWLLGLLFRHAPDFSNWRSGSPQIDGSRLGAAGPSVSPVKETEPGGSRQSAAKDALTDRGLRLARMRELESRVGSLPGGETGLDFRNISELALIYAREGREEESRGLLRRVMEAAELSRSHRMLHNLLKELSSAWLLAGQPSLSRETAALLAASARLRAFLEPDLDDWQRDLTISHDRFGDIAVEQGDLPAAKAAYTAGMEIAKTLAARDPESTLWQRDLSISHSKLGNIAVAQGDLPAAQAAYTACLEIAETLAARDPENTLWQRDLFVSHVKLGDIAEAQGDLPAAKAAYTACLETAETLAARDPENTLWQRDLFVSHVKLGDIAEAQGDLPAAKAAYTACLETAETLSARDPENTLWQRDLWVSHYKLAEVAERAGNAAEARAEYRQSHAILAALLAAGKHVSPEDMEWLVNLKEKAGIE